MSVFVKAAVEALKAYPVVNARIDGNDLVMQHFYDIGVAVSTEKGLMVPVLRGADRLGFAEDYARRALALFGPPCINADRMIGWIADWVRRGGPTLGKPTHFEVRDGKF